MSEYYGPYWGVEDTPTSDADWFYASQEDVEDLIGSQSLILISNEPDSATPTVADAARIQRIGELVDALMDGELARLGYTTPLAAMSAGTALIMANVSAGLVVRELNRPRSMLQVAPKGIKNLSEMDQRIINAMGDAEATWRRIKLGLIRITATKTYATVAPAAVRTFAGTVSGYLVYP